MVHRYDGVLTFGHGVSHELPSQPNLPAFLISNINFQQSCWLDVQEVRSGNKRIKVRFGKVDNDMGLSCLGPTSKVSTDIMTVFIKSYPLPCWFCGGSLSATDSSLTEASWAATGSSGALEGAVLLSLSFLLSISFGTDAGA